MKVLIYPRGENPYQELLYAPLRTSYPESLFLYINANRLNFLLLPLIFLVRRIQGYRILHLHWANFSISAPIPFKNKLSYWYGILCISSLRILGYKIIWTIHNVVPHESQRDDHLKLVQYISRVAKAKIVHSAFTLEDMTKHGFNTSSAIVIPIGNYIGVYPEKVTRKQARCSLNANNRELVVLFFGLIRPYKGVDNLVNIFEKLSKMNIKLIIAGKCFNRILYEKIIDAQAKCNIDFYNGHVPDQDVATYFEAADIVCLPFKTITTSSSAMLALSFGKPVIAPRAGALKDLPNNVGYLYDPKNPHGLEQSLRLAISKKSQLSRLGSNAMTYANTLSWDKISEKTYNLYKDVLNY